MHKNLLKRYKILTISLKACCIICIIFSVILTSRIIKIDTLEQDIYNRDIYLCMDVSTSVDELNLGLVGCLKDIVSNLHGERFGVSIFNTSSVVISPLTDDYQFVNNVLDTLETCFNVSLRNIDYSSYHQNYLYNGTLVGNETRGSSLIGDGLASCVFSFPNLEEERTRIIISKKTNRK